VLLVIGVATFVVALLAAWATVRHLRVRADSLHRYSRAVTALRSASELRPEPRIDLARDERARELRASVRVLDEVAPIRQAVDRRVRASRLAARPDPELLARRPVIANLPSMPESPAAAGGDPGQQAG
jgi:hypothetical protein